MRFIFRCVIRKHWVRRSLWKCSDTSCSLIKIAITSIFTLPENLLQDKPTLHTLFKHSKNRRYHQSHYTDTSHYTYNTKVTLRNVYKEYKPSKGRYMSVINTLHSNACDALCFEAAVRPEKDGAAASETRPQLPVCWKDPVVAASFLARSLSAGWPTTLASSCAVEGGRGATPILPLRMAWFS